MYRKFCFSVFLAGFLFLAGSSALFAQTAPVSGRVELKKADGTTEPVTGALVEVFRSDVKGKFPSDKTDKKGQFSFAGLPLGATFIFSVSAAGASPGYVPNIKAGMDKLLITLSEGDGKRWTEEEVRQGNSPSPAPAANKQARQPSVDEKKAIAERAKLEAEYAAKKQEAEGKNAIISKSLTDGNKAFNEKNYDLAITTYSEGIAADPTYVGSAPVLLNNKGVALKIRAVDSYNKATKSTDPAEKTATMAKAKQDMQDSLESFTNSWTILKNAPPVEITDKANYDKAKYDALNGLTETYRLSVATKTNVAKAADAKEAFDAYLALETDAAKKAKVQVTFGDVMLEAGESDMALAAYRVALEASPDNPDALAGVGFSLVNLGFLNDDKTKLQEGANFLQKFANAAPDTHKYKADALGLIETLKTEQKVTPQKVTSTKKKT